LMSGRVGGELRGPIRAAAAALSLCALAVMMFVPVADVDRLILPFYILLLPYAALGMIRAVDFLVPPEEQ